MDYGVRYCIVGLGEDRIKHGVSLAHGKAVIHVHAGINGGQMKLFTLFGNIAVSVVADDYAVRFPGRNRLQPGRCVHKICPVPGREIIGQPHIIVSIALVNDYGNILLYDEFFLL